MYPVQEPRVHIQIQATNPNHQLRAALSMFPSEGRTESSSRGRELQT